MKVHIGFYNQLSDKWCGDVKYRVRDVCDSSNGRVIAFATSDKDAEIIVEALNREEDDEL